MVIVPDYPVLDSTDAISFLQLQRWESSGNSVMRTLARWEKYIYQQIADCPLDCLAIVSAPKANQSAVCCKAFEIKHCACSLEKLTFKTHNKVIVEPGTSRIAAQTSVVNTVLAVAAEKLKKS